MCRKFFALWKDPKKRKKNKKEKEKNFAQRRSFENDDFIGLAMEHRVVCRLCLDTHESMFRISIVTCAKQLCSRGCDEVGKGVGKGREGEACMHVVG